MQKPKGALFEFKSFRLYHGDVSLSIGTDAVLLGASAAKNHNPKTILDIGGGCGIIALMLAQRFKEAQITSIDINEEAVIQSDWNFKNSLFSNRLSTVHQDLRTFKPIQKFDLIVSNPPYFKRGLHPKSEVDKQSKHEISISISDLISFSERYLSENGLFVFIYPFSDIELLLRIISKSNLYIVAQLNVKPKQDSEIKRCILTLSRKVTSQKSIKTICIENEQRHDYHEDYKYLCKDFYLKF